jgi:glycosyltransferase involved in cell wall biosynthesis
MAELFTLLMLGSYLPKNARYGGPAQIFSWLVDGFADKSKYIKNFEVVVINTRIPPCAYIIKEGNMVKKNFPLMLLILLKILKRTKVVYLCGISIIGFLVFTLAWLLRKKTLYHLHGLEILEYRYDEKNLITSLPYIGIEKFLIKNSSALIHVSKLYEKITKELYKPRNLSFIIPNFLDPDSFNILKTLIFKQITLPKKYVLFVGKPTRQKGFDTFLILMNKVMEKYNDLQAIAVVGDIVKGQKKLEKYIKKQEIKKRILILGNMNKSSLFLLYQRALVVLIPSLIESYNMVALESLAVSTPIIISSMAGITEYLPKNNRYVHICDNLICFLENLEKYLKKGEMMVNRSSYTLVAKKFNINIALLRLLKILLTL